MLAVLKEQHNSTQLVRIVASFIIATCWRKRGMETNSTFNRGFGTAVAVVLSVEMILALIANGIVLLITMTQRKSWNNHQQCSSLLSYWHTL